jgi:hypothetical protein
MIVLGGNWDKSAVSLFHQVAAWAPDMFCSFYLAKHYKIANNSTTTEAKEKISRYWESLELQKYFDVFLIKF